MLYYRCKACLLAFVQLAAISGALATVAPYFIEEPSDTYVKKGKPTSLSCAVGGDPRPAVRWKRNGVTLDLTGDNRRTIKPDGSLYFSQIIHSRDEKPDEGTYQCEAVSRINNLDYMIVSRTVQVTVASISAKVSVAPNSIRVTFGGITRFYCMVKHSAPKAVIRWKKSGVEITTGGRFTLIPGGALQISNVQFTDQGKYSCLATNNVTSKSHTSSNAGNLIEVLADNGFVRRPRFLVQPADTIALKGSSVVLECAVNGSPKPRVSWLHDGTPVVLGNEHSLLGESNLKIEPVSVSHAGTYTCRAQGRLRREEAKAKLTVHYPPIFTKKHTAVHACVDSNARFECLADGMPKPEISWSISGDIIINTDYTKVGDGFLLVEDLVLSDMGVYQCFAKNSLGNIQHSAELSVYRKGECRLTTTTAAPTTIPTTTPLPTTTPTPTTPQRQVAESPENVVVRPISDSVIEVTWAPPSVPHGKILAYTIFYSLLEDGSAALQIVNTSGENLRKRITNLRPDSKYGFNVYANNKHGAGAISEKAEGKTFPSALVPGRPGNLVAEAESESTIRLTWLAPDSGVSSSVSRYVIHYREAGNNKPLMTDSTKQQTRVLRDLKTYTEYMISVFAENKIGVKGASSTVDATTLGGVPREPPSDFALKPDSSGTGLICTWNPPDPSKVNGRITFYVIKYKKVGSPKENQTDRIGAENLRYHITGLVPSTKYQAKIAAGTDSGLGEFTKEWVEESTNLTKCKETTNPGKPEITFVKAFSNMIKIGWAPPDNAGLVCVTGYNLGWGEHSPYQKTITLDSDKVEHIIQGLRSKQRYVVMLSASNVHGNGEDDQKEIRTPPGSGNLDVVKGLQALPLSPKEMQITWKDISVSSSVPVIYHVYSSVRNQLKYCGNTTKKTIKCSGLKPYNKYMFYVRRNMEKANATVSNYTEEDKPSSPVDLTGNPDEQNFTLLTLHWQPPLKPNGRILHYRIYYSTSKTASDELWSSMVINGSRLTQQISGLEAGTAYFFRMQARTRKGWGPLSAAKKISTLSEPIPAVEPTTVAGPGSLTTVPNEGEAGALAGAGPLKNKTLWIVIAAVAGITLIAIIIISVILCKKRSGDDIQRKPPTYKSVIQANGSAKKKHKEEKPPDLWINHTDNLEMKPMESVNPAPDVTNTSTIPRSSEEMKPLNDSPMDQIAIDQERNSFMNGSENDPDDFEDLPPPPVIDSKDEPYPDYIDSGNRTPTPPPSPGVPPYFPPRPSTPDNVYTGYPLTSTPTPRYNKALPRTGSCENTLEVAPEPRPPQRTRSYDPVFTSPMVPVFPGLYSPGSLPKPKPKPPLAPADDIQLPPVGYGRKRPPNGYWTPPPKYDDIFARRAPPASPPPIDQEAVVADLDKEIAGLEGLMRDLNEITAVDL